MKIVVAAGIVFACVAPTRAELTLIAQYDWQQGAADVSGSSIQHHGVLDDGASVVDGKLVTDGWDGVDLGEMPEFDGSTKVLLRFEDVSIDELNSGASGQYSVLTGGGEYAWWVGVNYDLPPYGNKTTLVFNIGGWSRPWQGWPNYNHHVVVADDVVTHFDRIEYRYDGMAPSDERLAIRFNDGSWTTGGWSEADDFRTFMSPDYVRINDGARADWDPLDATLGPVSYYCQQIPEPAAPTLLLSAAMACAASLRWWGIRQRARHSANRQSVGRVICGRAPERPSQACLRENS